MKSPSRPPNLDHAATPLVDLLTLNTDTFKQRFQGSPVLRIKRERLVRNTCIAAGNSGSMALAPQLESLLGDSSPLVRGHAAWALQRVLGDAAPPNLERMYTA